MLLAVRTFFVFERCLYCQLSYWWWSDWAPTLAMMHLPYFFVGSVWAFWVLVCCTNHHYWSFLLSFPPPCLPNIVLDIVSNIVESIQLTISINDPHTTSIRWLLPIGISIVYLVIINIVVNTSIWWLLSDKVYLVILYVWLHI